ncbi:hypothetical protein UM764_12545 [Staphylococcus aureus]|nr:hypothetical protein UM764_12545 [Staphylococcus aureus]
MDFYLGALAGLVVITPAAGYVTYLSATIMALIGVSVVILSSIT